MCGNCVRQNSARECPRSWLQFHRTHLSFFLNFVLYLRFTWRTSWSIGLLQQSNSLAFFDQNASFLGFVSEHVLHESHSSSDFITIHNPFVLLCTHFDFTISLLRLIHKIISWALCSFFSWIATKSLVTLLTMLAHFLIAILVLALKDGFCS